MRWTTIAHAIVAILWTCGKTALRLVAFLFLFIAFLLRSASNR